ncbi:phosphonate metabolism protein/1,5-bisphosphokinase (PRPP-forming) PhnN [Albibacillus kandeliae]|uniref:phosphonate metabolism protein/1,5-bisphosphokinase (PRPP-forming) PhnN n=1 Tax=Albibacillus kandeliae TaxID=2174228 RepID=UPI000D694B9C|nr:phosphonate metabolism protein/1,5-bisphosphokinase (PRPP-forming) PhnN [Albibacillus kandeliae]
MAGRLFAVVGPSGVGKDTLMTAARQARPGLTLVRRVITRPAEAGGEDFESVTPQVFEARLRNGDFVLHWQAHGLSYGIPKGVHSVLASGRDALFNGSRAMLDEAARAFPGLHVLHITAKPEVLAERLAARGRETPDEIRRRLARAPLPLPEGLSVIEIDNSDPVEQTLPRLLAALDSEKV